MPAEALTVWKEKGLIQFKVGRITLDERRDNAALERAVRARARPVEGQLVYAYLLDRRDSTAWWREWGGYDLEGEILTEAVLAIPAVRAKLDGFDPKDNEWGVDNAEDYRDILVHAHHGEVGEEEIRKGFRRWLATLPPDARRLFARDLKAWMG